MSLAQCCVIHWQVLTASKKLTLRCDANHVFCQRSSNFVKLNGLNSRILNNLCSETEMAAAHLLLRAKRQMFLFNYAVNCWYYIASVVEEQNTNTER